MLKLTSERVRDVGLELQSYRFKDFAVTPNGHTQLFLHIRISSIFTVSRSHIQVSSPVLAHGKHIGLNSKEKCPTKLTKCLKVTRS